MRLINSHPNVEIRVFNPFANRARRLGDFIGDTRRINRRMHNKTLTADNIVTIFGGRNIGDEYFSADKDVGFGDMDALAIGPIAGEVSAQFDLYWNSEWAYPIAAFEWKNHLNKPISSLSGKVRPIPGGRSPVGLWRYIASIRNDHYEEYYRAEICLVNMVIGL